MIEITEQVVFIGYLLIAAWQDMKSRSVAIWVYGLFGSAAWFLKLCETGPSDWNALWCGAGICGLLLVLNKITEGGIGEGDGYFFIVAGLFLGAWKTIVLFCGGVIACGCCCMGLMLWGMGKQVSLRKKTVPFLPFLMPIGICLMVF